MQYLVTFEDGVKGMHWGVRNAETLRKYQGADGHVKAKGLQKALNYTDRRIQNNTRQMYNSIKSGQYYAIKAKKAEKRGNSKKADKYNALVSASKKHGEAYAKDYSKAVKDQIKNLKTLQNGEYVWKNTPRNFQSYYPTAYAQAKEYTKKYGKVSLMAYSNATSGNHYKVREASKTSTKKQMKWSNKHGITTSRPQRVDYYYV